MHISIDAMNDADFTFVIPNTRWFGKRHWNHIPYAEGVLSAMLRSNGYTVSAIDANVDNLSEKELLSLIEGLKPKMIGIGCMSIEYKDLVHETFRIIKSASPSTITVIGGVYPTLSPEVVTEDTNIDYFIFSEGEYRLLNLLNALSGEGSSIKINNIDGIAYREEGKLKINPATEGAITDLDTIPWPDYSDYDMDRLTNWGHKYTQNFQFKQFPVCITMTSRGCPYKCTYCAAGKDMNPINDGRVRGRSPENVVGEINYLRNKYGIREIVFTDDSLLLPRKRAVKMLEILADDRKKGSDLVWKSNNLDIRHVNEEILRLMFESGCYQLNFSLESGSPNTLKRMKRRTSILKSVEALEIAREIGFDEIISNFVVGFPGDTWDDVRETFGFADDLRRKGLLDYALFSIATPLPNTELLDQAMAGGHLASDFDPTHFYGFGKGLITTSEFSPDELQILRAYEWDRINFKCKDDKIKISRMLGISLDELEVWRRETRRNVGVKVKSVDHGE